MCAGHAHTQAKWGTLATHRTHVHTARTRSMQTRGCAGRMVRLALHGNAPYRTARHGTVPQRSTTHRRLIQKAHTEGSYRGLIQRAHTEGSYSHASHPRHAHVGCAHGTHAQDARHGTACTRCIARIARRHGTGHTGRMGCVCAHAHAHLRTCMYARMAFEGRGLGAWCRLFCWLVKRINESVAQPDCSSIISVRFFWGVVAVRETTPKAVQHGEALRGAVCN